MEDLKQKTSMNDQKQKITMTAVKNKIIIPELSGYFGSKEAAGTYQTIINQIPPFEAFYSLFAGNDAIVRNIDRKKSHFFLFDKDRHVVDAWNNYFYEAERPFVLAYRKDGIEILKTSVNWHNDELKNNFFYLDPPYLLETRKQKRNVYKYELSENDHLTILTYAKKLNFNTAISHYPCKLYDTEFKDWRKIEYQTMTRTGPVIEALYMNYDEPKELHDYRFLGNDYIDRQRIKRRISRNVKRLNDMPVLERKAILQAIGNEFFNNYSLGP
jgi:DNA adenine methylase